MLRTKLALIVALLCAAQPVLAAFEDSGFSARAVAMGSAFTAVTDDPVSVFYNPAGLGFIDRASVQTSYLRQFDIAAGKVDQEFVDLVGAVPVHQEIINGTFAGSFINNQQLNLGEERSIGLSYGTRSMHEFDGGQVELGGTFRTLSKGYDSGGSDAIRIGIDAGMITRFWDRYTAGVSLLNLDGPPMSGPGFHDRAPAMIKIGLAESVRGFTYAADITKREPSGGHPGTANLGVGLEHWWATTRNGSWALRSGMSLGDSDKTWNAGFGWRLLGGQLDYAFTLPMQGQTNIGHAVSLSFRFGQSNPEGEYERVLKDELSYRKDLTKALDAGENRQWRLSEELNNLRDEIKVLRQQLVDKTTSESQARRKIQDLEERHRQVLEEFRKMQDEAAKTKDVRFHEDWAAYQKLKLGGAPDSILTDEIKRILREYKDSGVDLSPANEELLRLLRGG
jgi:hypothetical protein